jgi:hypothetical protein
MIIFRFCQAEGNRRTGETGQPAKPSQPFSINFLWHSRLSLNWPRGPGSLRRDINSDIGIVLSPGDDIDKQIERRGAEKHHRKADDKNK